MRNSLLHAMSARHWGSRAVILVLLFSCFAWPLRAETTKTVTVLVASDISGRNLGTPLQYAIAQLLRSVGRFNVQLSPFVLPGFTPQDTKTAHEKLATDLFTFAYLEPARLSLFLFSKEYPGQFLLISKPLRDSPGQAITIRMIEERLQLGFIALINALDAKQFQYLPGARPEAELVDSGDEMERKRAIQAGLLFRELAAIQEHPLYVGANIGMARFGTSTSSTSVVNFGGFVGYQLLGPFSVEVSLEFFSYIMAHADLRCRLPLPGKYVSFNLGVGAGRILYLLTENRGVDTNLHVGESLYGPGLTFDIPLLGAVLRGGVGLYFGTDKVLIGNYGISYSVAL